MFIFFLFACPFPLWGKDWYVRPAGGNYGMENGTGYENAWDGLLKIKWGEGGVQPGDTLYICGTHAYHMKGIRPGLWDGVEAADIHLKGGTGESQRVVIRGDYPGDPGVIFHGYILRYKPWQLVPDTDNSIYKVQFIGNHHSYPFFEKAGKGTYQVMARTRSFEELKSKPGTYYAKSFKRDNFLYVHCSDNGDPTGRIVFPQYGYDFVYKGANYVTFKNLSFYQLYKFFNKKDPASHIRIKGCKLLHGDSHLLAIYLGFENIEILNCEIAYGGNGIYTITGNKPSGPSNCTFSGNYIHDIGIVHKNGDAHGIGIQGGHDNLIEKNILTIQSILLALLNLKTIQPGSKKL